MRIRSTAYSVWYQILFRYPKTMKGALEAALGEKSNWVVVRDSRDALTAIDLLKNSSSGRGTFFPASNQGLPGGFLHFKFEL